MVMFSCCHRFLISSICLCECPCDAVEKQEKLEDFVDGSDAPPLQTCEIAHLDAQQKTRSFDAGSTCWQELIYF